MKPVTWFLATCAIRGLQGVVAPLRTQSNALWTKLGVWTITVYPFIEGEQGWNPGMTDAQWRGCGNRSPPYASGQAASGRL